MPNLYLLLLAIFATYRLAELVSIDTIFEPLRLSLGKRVDPTRHNKDWYAAELVNCPYCLGVWFALLFALVIAHGWQYVLLVWFAIAGGQAFLESLAGRSE